MRNGSGRFRTPGGIRLRAPTTAHTLHLRTGLLESRRSAETCNSISRGSSSASSAPFLTLSPCATGTSSTCPGSLKARFTASSGVASPAKSLSMTAAPAAVVTLTGRTVSGTGWRRAQAPRSKTTIKTWKVRIIRKLTPFPGSTFIPHAAKCPYGRISRQFFLARITPSSSTTMPLLARSMVFMVEASML